MQGGIICPDGYSHMDGPIGNSTCQLTTPSACPTNGGPDPYISAGSEPDDGGSCEETSPILVGNPINAKTGNKYLREVDYVSSGPFPLAFVRHYNSVKVPEANLGHRWRHSYSARLYVEDNRHVAVLRPSGKAVEFELVLGAWTSTSDQIRRLRQVGAGWELTNERDEIETYTTAGVLQQVTDRAGWRHDLTYSDASTPFAVAPEAGLLIKVTDSVGRELKFTYSPAKRINTMQDPGGGLYDFQYDTRGNLEKVSYPGATPRPTRTYLYAHSASSNPLVQHALTGVKDENNITFATYTYHLSDGRALASEHAGGVEHVSLQYSAAASNPTGNTTVMDARGTARTYDFDIKLGLAKVASVSQPCPSCGGGSVSASTYDAYGFVATSTDFNGNATAHAREDPYGRHDLVTSRTQAAGMAEERTTTTQWHPTFRLPAGIAEPKRITTYQYDATTGRVTSKTVQATNDPDGSAGFSATPVGAPRVWSYSYQPSGTLGPIESMTEEGPRNVTPNDVTTWEYYPAAETCTASASDGSIFGCRGQLKRITNALGHETQFTRYTAHGQVEEIVDPNRLTITLAYDARQRLIAREVGGELTRYDYDNVGQLTTVTLPDASALTYSYDDAHRLIGIADSLGNRIAYTLDAMSNRVKEDTIDPAGQLAATRGRVYNALNRLVQDIGGTNPAAQITRYGYDAQGNPISVSDPLNRTTTQAFDALNRLVAMVDPQAGTTRYGYDGLDQLTQVTDARGLSTAYGIDGLGNLESQLSPDTGTTANTYDAAGNLLASTDARGVTASYRYDALNRLTEATFTPPAGPTLAPLTHTYEYDQGVNGIGRLTRITDATGSTSYAYDLRGRIVQDTRVIAGVGYTTAYQYDSAGRLIGITYPSGRQVGYTLDGLGSVSAITTTYKGATQIVVAAVTYRPFGGVESFVFGNGQPYMRSFDLDGRITGYTLGDRSQILTWDAASRIVALTDAANPSNPTLMAYDSLDRLTSSITPSSSQNFTYDAVGNRLSQSIGANTYRYSYAVGSNRLLDASGPMPLSYSYDAGGQPVTSGKHIFAHDVRGRLSQVINASSGGLLAHYEINALGQRVHKLTGSGSGRVFLYDVAGRLIGEANPGGQALWDHIWLGDMPVAWISADQDEDGVPDELDNCINVANANQHDPDQDGIGEMCDGDVNRDGRVDRSDATTIQRCLVRLIPCESKYDTDGNGVVTSRDASFVNRRVVAGLSQGPSGVRGEAAVASVFYVHPDHLNTPRVLTNKQNRILWQWDNADPFGANMASEDPDTDYIYYRYPLRFPGQYFDNETRLHYNYYRDYDPQTGRYVQSDPIGLEGGINTYGYAGQDPLRKIDPDGRWFFLVIPGLCAGGGCELLFGGAALWCILNSQHTGDKAKGSSSPNTLEPGPHAGDSVPARGSGRNFDKGQRDAVNDVGDRSGCHTCGADEPGTKSGNWVPDHQPPSSLNPEGNPQQLYPQCINCSRVQGGQARGAKGKAGGTSGQ